MLWWWTLFVTLPLGQAQGTYLYTVTEFVKISVAEPAEAI